jgi:RNA polymerase sigma factor (sigma-70 family)
MQQRSFDTVVADHGATVLRVCLAVLGPTEAEDAWSETFLSAMQAYRELPADANVEAWLVTIAHRKAIDVVRAAARRAVPVEQVQDAVPAPSADSRDLDLVAEMRRLPPRQKQAVAYHYLAGLPYSEVAAVVGGTADAARRAAADGIAALRRSYPVVADLDGAGDRATRSPGIHSSRSSDARSSTRGVSR